MSEPKRYGHKAIIYPKSDDDTYITIPVEEPDGHWVTWKDYARLKAEVERLRKAGDEMEDAIINGSLNALNKARDNWNTAKEGKPDIDKVEIDDETWDRENKAYKEARAKEMKAKEGKQP